MKFAVSFRYHAKSDFSKPHVMIAYEVLYRKIPASHQQAHQQTTTNVAGRETGLSSQADQLFCKMRKASASGISHDNHVLDSYSEFAG